MPATTDEQHNPRMEWRRVSRPEMEAAAPLVLRRTYWDGTDMNCWVRTK